MKASHRCDATFCLTLEDAHTRQVAVTRELNRVGMADIDFVFGVRPDDAVVQAAFDTGRVKRYPPCFRCGELACDRVNCNNILLPVQVAVVLAFRQVFKHLLDSGLKTAAVCEDDIVFAKYAPAVFTSDRYRALIDQSGLRSDTPTLVRLGGPARPPNFLETHLDESSIVINKRVTMSNYLFLCNRSFASLAYARLETIDHTADRLIHQSMLASANCLTLSPQLVCDESYALRTAQSLIHPKPEYLEYLRQTVGEHSAPFQSEQTRLQRHKKRARSFPHVFVTMVGAEVQALILSCAAAGLEIGDGVPARDGFAAWQYAHPKAIEHLADAELNDDFFVHAQRYHLLIADPFQAIDGLARCLSNQDEAAARALAIVDEVFGLATMHPARSVLDTAALLYVFWYRLARRLPLVSAVHADDLLQEGRLAETLSQGGFGKHTLDAVRFASLTARLGAAVARELALELAALGFADQSPPA